MAAGVSARGQQQGSVQGAGGGDGASGAGRSCPQEGDLRLLILLCSVALQRPRVASVPVTRDGAGAASRHGDADVEGGTQEPREPRASALSSRCRPLPAPRLARGRR